MNYRDNDSPTAEIYPFNTNNTLQNLAKAYFKTGKQIKINK